MITLSFGTSFLKKKINFTTPYKPQERDKEINFN